ncbi:MAG: radical SAM family heme chaperone HemW [Campylobacter sp.]|nr:radical SAM family heme chaperone HemW [Campylobacter sp.]
MDHIYIHIPFCNSKCPYCAFGSLVGKNALFDKYFKALKLEIKQAKFDEISTIFIGGGTPSVVDSRFYAEIFEILSESLARNAEISTEANPESVSESWLRDMKSLGINRISFGTQSFDDKKLKFLGRIHSRDDIFKSVEMAKKAGFENINADFIYATKFDDEKFLKREIKALLSLNTTHISAYSLTLEENTPFFGKTNFCNDDENLAKFVINELENGGFKQYEISNFGEICKHNFSYWNGEKYYGFGAWAVGFDGKKRIYSPKNLDEYILNPLQKTYENLSDDDLRLEKIFLGSRSVIGIDEMILSPKMRERAEILCENGLLKKQKKRYFSCDFLLADEIALFISS